MTIKIYNFDKNNKIIEYFNISWYDQLITFLNIFLILVFIYLIIFYINIALSSNQF